MYVQGACAVFLAALAGPGLVAPDLANNALPLYFSRPLTRWSYALARLTVIIGMVVITTLVVPPLMGPLVRRAEPEALAAEA